MLLRVRNGTYSVIKSRLDAYILIAAACMLVIPFTLRNLMQNEHLAVAIYDSILTFPLEKKIIWTRNFTITKVLYFFNRYVFLVFAPKNGTTEPLHPSKPQERKHWGTGKERGGVREWAQENELVPVAANFIYSENEKQ